MKGLIDPPRNSSARKTLAQAQIDSSKLDGQVWAYSQFAQNAPPDSWPGPAAALRNCARKIGQLSAQTARVTKLKNQMNALHSQIEAILAQLNRVILGKDARSLCLACYWRADIS